MEITQNQIRIVRDLKIVQPIQRQVLSQLQCQRSHETKPREDELKTVSKDSFPPPPRAQTHTTLILLYPHGQCL